MNKEDIKSIIDSVSSSTATEIIYITFDNIGKKLSNIINQDGDEKTDGQCLDEIVDYLKSINLYYDRK